MAELTPDIVAKVAETCKSGADEAAEAIGRALDAAGAKLTAGEPGTLDVQNPPEGFDGPGLVVVLTVGSSAALVLLPESTGVLPAWCADPDPTGQSKLTTLAQELGMILLPEEVMPEQFQAAWVKDLSGALGRGEISSAAAIVPLEFSHEDKQATLSLVWPASKPEAVIAQGEDQPKPDEKAESKPKPAPKAAGPKPTVAGPTRKPAGAPKFGAPQSGVPQSGVPQSGVPQSGVPQSGVPQSGVPQSGVPQSGVPQSGVPQSGVPQSGVPQSGVPQSGVPQSGVPQSGGAPKIRDLPPYTRSLLKIKVPVVVTLARKRQPVGRIVELGPGSIIQFDKSCEETLDLEVGAQSVAVGEAVKVGDKFGLRITSIALPEERFKMVLPKGRR